MKTKCLVVDDEPLAIEVISSHIAKIDSLELTGSCQNAFETFNTLRDQKVDLLFLDIHMPEIKGTQLVKSLSHPPKIIFTTAYREYAVEGFDLNAVDYLLKPISFERFLKAVDKFHEGNAGSQDIRFIPNSSPSNGFIHIREKNNIHRIPSSDILYIESLGDYVRIHTAKEKLTIRSPLSQLQKQLPETVFLRIHRSFIVSTEHISTFSPTHVLVGEKDFPIGNTYRANVMQALNYNMY